MPNASTPWSTRTVAEGGTDSPVGDLVPVPDQITPVVSTGFIATTGKYNGITADDREFTFQDADQAIGPGADIEFAVNMLKHDMMILAMLDSSGNAINVDVIANNPTTLSGPYGAIQFSETAVNGSNVWTLNKRTTDGDLESILKDTSTPLTATWGFF